MKNYDTRFIANTASSVRDLGDRFTIIRVSAEIGLGNEWTWDISVPTAHAVKIFTSPLSEAALHLAATLQSYGSADHFGRPTPPEGSEHLDTLCGQLRRFSTVAQNDNLY